MTRLAIFASGSGSNAENISHYFKDRTDVEVVVFLTNNPEAGVLVRAKKLQIPVLYFNKAQFQNSDYVLNFLQDQRIDYLIMAGFLWLVPANLIAAFPNKIINVHPALLPKYGGKGMWGHHVHEAVVKNKEVESGITIHYVNEAYDEGKIIFQAKCEVLEEDSAENVAAKIHLLEYEHFPKVIDQIIKESQF